jgi:hypothetical protein
MAAPYVSRWALVAVLFAAALAVAACGSDDGEETVVEIERVLAAEG